MDYKEKYEKALGRAKTFSQRWQGIEATDSELALKELKEIFPELKESEDERMVKFIKNQLFNIKKTITENYELDAKLTNAIDWLEKQGEHANFRNKIQIGDKVTRNEDGVLVNLSQLERVAKPAEKQGSQNLANSAKTCKDEQKPTEWSEEDEGWMKSTFDKLSIEGDMCLGEKCWIQSLKQRMKGE